MSLPLHKITNLTDGPISIHLAKNHPTQSIGLHSHAFYEIIFVKQGTADYIIADKSYTAQKGSLVAIPPHTPHQILFGNMSVAYERYIFWVDTTFWLQVKQPFINLDFAINRCESMNIYMASIHPNVFDPLLLLFDGIHTDFLKNGATCNDLLLARTLVLIATINHTLYTQQFDLLPFVEATPLDKLLDYVDSHLSHPLQTQDIADHLNMSTASISRLCKTRLGISLYQFVLKRRLIYSQSQILADIPLNLVYQNVGFSDYSAFYRAFKKEFGTSPTHFKQSINHH